jgi:hypothetical protein
MAIMELIFVLSARKYQVAGWVKDPCNRHE